MPDDPAPLTQPAVVDLLGVLAYGQLSAFTHVAGDSGLAPLEARRLVGRTAVDFFTHFEQLAERLDRMGVSIEDAMAPFVQVIDEYHERTQPTDWLEGLVKAYVGDGIARDFYREISNFVDEDTRGFVLGILEDHGQAAFIVAEVRQAIAADPRVEGRLALWGRRLVGEAIQRAQRVGAEHDALTALLVGGERGADVVELGRMFSRLTDAHTRRMERMGLDA